MTDYINDFPKMLTGSELDDKLRILPEYSEDIKKADMTERLIALQNIYNIFLPSAMSREIYCKIYLAFLRSMKKKQGIIAIRQMNQNGNIIRQKKYESIIGGSDSFTIIGPSGIGKTSAVSRAVNILTENAVIELEDVKLIPCLQVQAPADSSVKGLIMEILRKTDEWIQTSYFNDAVRSKATTDMLIGSVSQVALNHIGLLIIDEIQNIVNSKNGKTIIGTLTQFINNSGISVAMVGTPESRIFFEQHFMLARRSLGLSYDALTYNENFRNFCLTLLSYQYVSGDVDTSEGVLLWLFNHSDGNISIIVGLIHDAQEIAILEKYERLDIHTLNLAFERRLKMLHSYVESPHKSPQKPRKKPKKAYTCKETVTPAKRSDILGITAKAKSEKLNTVTELRNAGINVIEVTTE